MKTTNAPHYSAAGVTLFHGDCIRVMRGMADESVHAIVTDPPYGLGFMGREWDALPPGEEFAREALRVLKPGGHIVAFGGSRTWHRLAVAIEDAGFEIRDSIAWLYASGFPKSVDVSKAIDKAAGAERTERLGVKPGHEAFVGRDNVKSLRETGALAGKGGYSRPWMHDPEKVEASHFAFAPATEAAREWQGWGTALKPAFEPIVVGRKPLAGTVAANVLTHGTGALNIDATRVGVSGGTRAIPGSTPNRLNAVYGTGLGGNPTDPDAELGRWPSNVVLDESQGAELDAQSGTSKSRSGGVSTKALGVMNDDDWIARDMPRTGHDDIGGASRFFPVFRFEAKAPTSERPVVDGVAHPTVKPLALMRWLCRLVTPKGGTILEPFAGSGTTLEAAIAEGFDVIGIEREDTYLPLILQRIRKDHAVVLDLWGDEA